MRIVADDPDRTLVVFHQWRYLRGESLDRLVGKREIYEDFFLRTVRAGVESGEFTPDLDVRVAVLTILGALNWTPQWFSPSGRASAEEVAEVIADSLLRGALIRGPGDRRR